VAAGFPTTVNPIIQFGAIPVFVDVDKYTHNIDALKIEEAITLKTKAIMLAHSLGNPFNSYHMNLQWHFCDKKLALIWCNAIKAIG
jgi:dTDP-4-amino-4,6-dideoxygalactose transaminase